jgi:hypothetical protein
MADAAVPRLLSAVEAIRLDRADITVKRSACPHLAPVTQLSPRSASGEQQGARKPPNELASAGPSNAPARGLPISELRDETLTALSATEWLNTLRRHLLAEGQTAQPLVT